MARASEVRCMRDIRVEDLAEPVVVVVPECLVVDACLFTPLVNNNNTTSRLLLLSSCHNGMKTDGH